MQMKLKWKNIVFYAVIAFKYEFIELMAEVMKFIDNNLKDIVKKLDYKELIQLNHSTHNKLLEMMIDICRQRY